MPIEMPLRPRHLGQVVTTATPAVLYTVPTGVFTIVKEILCCNSTADNGNKDLSIHMIKGAGAVSPSNAILYSKTIPYGGTFGLELSLVMEAGWRLVVSSDDTGVTLTASGVETLSDFEENP